MERTVLFLAMINSISYLENDTIEHDETDKSHSVLLFFLLAAYQRRRVIFCALEWQGHVSISQYCTTAVCNPSTFS